VRSSSSLTPDTAAPLSSSTPAIAGVQDEGQRRRPSSVRSAGASAAALIGRSAVIGGFIAMLVMFTALEPQTFPAWATVKNVLDQSVVPVILACGLTFVLVVGEFDLSYTATVGLCAGVVIKLVASSGFAVGPAIVVTIVAAAAVGLIVGLLVTLGRASSFIVTLAIGSAVTGLEQAITGNQTIYQGIPTNFANLTADQFLGLHLPVWLALGVLCVSVVLLHATRFGRHAKAIGGNTAAAYLAGVRVRRVKVASFVLVAILAGICAIILTSRSASYYPNASAGFLLNTYAAAFLGAAVGSRSGFTVAGSAFGVLWITTLQTGLTLHNEPAWTSNFIQGLVLAAAVLIAARSRRRSR
jgi:ribose transport system permease protein